MRINRGSILFFNGYYRIPKPIFGIDVLLLHKNLIK